ncbi:phosphatidylinositol transfer protein csr1 [Sorochytrium milnesiophthora]
MTELYKIPVEDSPEYRALIDRVRADEDLKQLSSASFTDRDIFRFFLADDFDSDKAFERICNTLKWRKEVSWDTLLEQDFSDIETSHEVYQCPGLSRDGMAVFMWRSRVHYAGRFSNERLVLFLAQIVKRGWEQGTLSDKIIVVMDQTDAGMANNDLGFNKYMISTFDAHFPEFLSKVALAPTGWVIRGVWMAVAPFLNPKTRSKVLLLSDQDFRPTLAEWVDPQYLPTRLGGTWEGELPAVDWDRATRSNKSTPQSSAISLPETTEAVA